MPLAQPLNPARDPSRLAATGSPGEFVTPNVSLAPSSCIVFIGVRTTGPDPCRHEILEVAVIRAEPRTLRHIGTALMRVRPEHLGTAEAEALKICGYNAEDWKDAIALREAMAWVAALLPGALIAGHNVAFDWGFVQAGIHRAGIALPETAHHQLDTASLAWPLLATGAIDSLSLSNLARHFGLRHDRPGRALDDATASYGVAFAILGPAALGHRIYGLAPHERQITETLLERLDQGRKHYGEWNTHDGRDYSKEAYEEILDGLHYLAAALVQLRHYKAAHKPRVYVCHPFASDPAGNIERVRRISQLLIDDGVLPIAPHLFLPQLIDEATGREQALALCLELLATCDEVRVFGDIVTEGMERELREAKRLGIPARFVRETQGVRA